MRECTALRTHEWSARQRALALAMALTLLAPAIATSSSKVRLHGYITSRVDDRVVLILDDRLETTPVSRVVGQDSSGEHSMKAEELAVGMLVDAEGQWLDRHKFFPEKITVDLKESEKKIHGTAYLQEEPAEAGKIAAGDAGRLRLDGYLLQVGASTKREWSVAKFAAAPSAGAAGSSQGQLAGCHVKYTGIRRKDGTVEAEQIDLGPPASADAYKMPHGMEVVQAKDALTGTNILEFRQGKKVQGRLKLLEERSVREYVSHLGDSLLPAGAEGTSRPIEFRFFVVEDPAINAAALPDGTLLINTGLLGAMENESQLAFVMSHEMAHVLQAHYKREVEETRGARVGLTIAGLAAGAFIGDLGTFMADLGIASVVNGHQRELENQADRLGLQNVIEHGYDPREAPNFSRVIINRYGDRSTSKLWSNHDSSLVRGSFLAIQLQRAYPDNTWEGTRKNTPAFQKMKEDLGPVKIM
jgi:peptidase M48-like protein